MEQLLTIGEFAQRSGLSRSALRFYDQNELLRPQLVDEQTGYRYYALGQLEQADLVCRLRAAEMPIGAVRRFLAAAPAERHTILEAHAATFRQRASIVESTVDALRRELDPDLQGHVDGCLVLAAEFAEGLQQVSFALGDPAVRAELDAVWIETKEDSLRLVVTDSYRLAVRDLVPERVGPAALRGVIEPRHAHELAAELGDARRLLLSQDPAGVISVSVDGHQCRVGHGGRDFPDYERILTELPTGDQIALARDALVPALDRLRPVSELVLSFEPARLVLEAGDAREAVAGNWSGAPLRVGVDGRFFAEAVDATVGPDVVIEALDPLRPITLRSADTGTFSVLTMPIRLPDPA